MSNTPKFETIVIAITKKQADDLRKMEKMLGQPRSQIIRRLLIKEFGS
ncbi:MAG: ribbon-helix-helix protein, CopG family [Gammaproteobacteria bacterium AqS3]|nr:ribbon-helix-helix protein, CopG family [Gammaproteobacteria bacterium AqS3]